MTDWTFQIVGVDGSNRDEISTARDRSVTWRLRDKGEASFTLDGRNPEALEVRELQTDLLIRYKGLTQYGWRGRIGSSTDDISAEAHTAQFSAVDYRGVLERRCMLDGVTRAYTNADTTAVAWSLINFTQYDAGLPPGGDLRIGQGNLTPTATLGAIEIASGKVISEAIDDLAAIYPTFHWWIDADLLFHAGPRGTFRDFPLTWPDTLQAVQRSFDPSSYANVLFQTGAEILAPSVVSVPDLADTAVRPEGRIETTEGNPDLTTQNQVNQTASGRLINLSVLAPGYTVTLRPGVWTPEECWIGDLVPLRVRSGRINVDNAVDRVEAITLTWPDGAVEPTVDISIGVDLRTNFPRLIRAIPPRLAQLARR